MYSSAENIPGRQKNDYKRDVRDIYQELIQMPFSGIGLDFVEEKETGNLIEKYGFPQDKLLFAGVVSGKSFR